MIHGRDGLVYPSRRDGVIITRPFTVGKGWEAMVIKISYSSNAFLTPTLHENRISVVESSDGV